MSKQVIFIAMVAAEIELDACLPLDRCIGTFASEAVAKARVEEYCRYESNNQRFPALWVRMDRPDEPGAQEYVRDDNISEAFGKVVPVMLERRQPGERRLTKITLTKGEQRC